MVQEQFTIEDFTDEAFNIYVGILTGNKLDFNSWAKDDDNFDEEDMWWGNINVC